MKDTMAPADIFSWSSSVVKGVAFPPLASPIFGEVVLCCSHS